MNITQQRLHSMSITLLKGIKDIEINLDSNMIAILGPNGSGKSTILHALACVYKPQSDILDYKFSQFFLPHPHALWQNSEFEIEYTHREDKDLKEKNKKKYSKNTDRWSPKYISRPKRDTYYIGVANSVPLIEREKHSSAIKYNTTLIRESYTRELLNHASLIFNQKYIEMTNNKYKQKIYIGVETEDLKYSALSMSAGEQRVFFMLDILYKAKDYSLILIDEFDLLLHDDAFHRLVEVAYNIANKKKLQIIFTTHRESVIQDSNKVSLRHIFKTNNTTYCLSDTKPDTIRRLTGKQEKPLDIYVEDQLSELIIKKIAGSLKLTRYINVIKYGAAENCFNIAAAIAITGGLDQAVFVHDGDVYSNTEALIKRINRSLSGNDKNAVDLREKILKSICVYILNKNADGCKTPEEEIAEMIKAVPNDRICYPDQSEMKKAIEEISIVENKHDYINIPIKTLGLSYETAIERILNIACLSDNWSIFISQITKKLTEHRESLVENLDSDKELS